MSEEGTDLVEEESNGAVGRAPENVHVGPEGDCPVWCPSCKRAASGNIRIDTVIQVDSAVDAKRIDLAIAELVGDVPFTDAQVLIAKTCDELKAFLLEKNRGYGNSALEPIRIFSKSPADEQLKVRIDDKLTRIRNGVADAEDTELDLLGYLLLLRVHRIQRG